MLISDSELYYVLRLIKYELDINVKTLKTDYLQL